MINSTMIEKRKRQFLFFTIDYKYTHFTIDEMYIVYNMFLKILKDFLLNTG